jgi:hypothetical protein
MGGEARIVAFFGFYAKLLIKLECRLLLEGFPILFLNAQENCEIVVVP